MIEALLIPLINKKMNQITKNKIEKIERKLKQQITDENYKESKFADFGNLVSVLVGRAVIIVIFIILFFLIMIFLDGEAPLGFYLFMFCMIIFFIILRIIATKDSGIILFTESSFTIVKGNVKNVYYFSQIREIIFGIGMKIILPEAVIHIKKFDTVKSIEFLDLIEKRYSYLLSNIPHEKYLQYKNNQMKQAIDYNVNLY